MAVLKTGISSQLSSTLGAYSIPAGVSSPTQIGIVIGVITTPNTPNRDLYEKNGKETGVGTIFYLPFSDANKNKKIKEINLSTCSPAKPLFSFIQDYPLPGEQVILYAASSPDSQTSDTNIQTYYLPSINLWNNQQQNSAQNDEWKTFIQNEDIKNLLAFEGDRIIQGRKGNGIRFGSTVSSYSDLNEWSSVGNNGDPIIIMVNGYITTTSGSVNIEEINKEMSSIYMTSTQILPLVPGALIKNPLNPSYEPKNYSSPQLILNSDRVTLNSKKDEVLLFAKTNIELNTDNIINLNAGKIIHLNIEGTNKDSKILLGTNKDGTVPISPVLLGDQTSILFEKILTAFQHLAFYLSTATSNPEGGPVTSVQNAGTQLYSDIEGLCNQLEKCLSTKVYTV